MAQTAMVGRIANSSRLFDFWVKLRRADRPAVTLTEAARPINSHWKMKQA
jgi:hypothetical protein